MRFAEKLQDAAQLASKRLFNPRRLALPAGDSADVGRIDPELSSNSRVEPPELGG